MNWKQRLVVLLGTLIIAVSLSSTAVGSLSYVIHLIVLAGGLYLFFEKVSEQGKFPKSVRIIGIVLIVICAAVLVTDKIISTNSDIELSGPKETARERAIRLYGEQQGETLETDYERYLRLTQIRSLSDKELIDLAQDCGLLTQLQADSLMKITDQRLGK